MLEENSVVLGNEQAGDGIARQVRLQRGSVAVEAVANIGGRALECPGRRGTFDAARRKEFIEMAELVKPRYAIPLWCRATNWNHTNGFNLQQHEFFENRERHLAAYAQENAAKLDAYYATEDKIRPTFKAFSSYFGEFLRSLPPLLFWGFQAGHGVQLAGQEGQALDR